MRDGVNTADLLGARVGVRWGAVVAAAAIAAIAWAWTASPARAAAVDPALDARVQQLTAELRCLVCQNQTIADSQAELAVQLKREVRQQLSQGASEQQVRDFMVQRYGDFVLYRPSLTGATRWLWWGPAGLLALGLATAGWQWQRRRLGVAAAAVRVPPAADTPHTVCTRHSPAFSESRHALGAARPWAVPGWGVALLAFTAGMYAWVGTPHAWRRAEVALPAQAFASSAASSTVAAGPGALTQSGMTTAQIEAMVARLAQRLQAQPDDVAGWRMLVRSHETLGRYGDAVAAWRRLFALRPPDADELTEFAVTLGMSQGQTLVGEPEHALHQALQLRPDHLQALALLGSAATDRGDHAQAIAHWRQILRHVPPDADVRAGIEAQIAKATAQAEALAAKARAGAQPTPRP